ncbi:hypothetical protein PGT21_014420 [Puccinia graminis f. sp. tritici]|uniref:Uncharacterized protein n=1 Tax=Puccinia graminis f. sp. tritici TaxID=56615 RepID=A0A5B0LMX8_PUCGR|nr:hypothetical protein PGT21_014420 [Puccinia graminis f. sp. tritici]
MVSGEKHAFWATGPSSSSSFDKQTSDISSVDVRLHTYIHTSTGRVTGYKSPILLAAKDALALDSFYLGRVVEVFFDLILSELLPTPPSISPGACSEAALIQQQPNTTLTTREYIFSNQSTASKAPLNPASD